MATGFDLVNAITGNDDLLARNNCVSVPIEMYEAIYGTPLTDSGDERIIQPGANMARDITTSLAVSATASENVTAVWHFMMDPVHHFAVLPWYHPIEPYWFFTVFMAYEGQYDVNDYVTGTAPAPATRANGGLGYQDAWPYNDMSTMLSQLLTSPTAWQDYFGTVGPNQATQITYWKFPFTPIDTAITNVNNYTFNG